MKEKKVLGIIPARYQSTRFPGKLLVSLLDKPILQHTYESAKQSQVLDELIVATDDSRIQNLIQDLGGKTVFTSEDCQNGTERIVEALEKNPSLQNYEIIVNLQGDHPFVSSEMIEALIILLKNDPSTQIATAVVPMKDLQSVAFPQYVKCVFDHNFNALYFSRSKIPYEGHLYYQHVGIYAYRKTFLNQYRHLKKSDLEKAENLEQLKFLENGYRIKVAMMKDMSHSIDTPDDLKRLKELLCR